MSAAIEYEGLRELAQALKETDAELLATLKIDLLVAGNIVRDEARGLFTRGVARSGSVARTAAGFESRVRAGGQAKALLVVAQGLRKTTGTRPDYGAYQMRHALLPARTRKLDEVEQILEDSVGSLLHRHGF